MRFSGILTLVLGVFAAPIQAQLFFPNQGQQCFIGPVSPFSPFRSSFGYQGFPYGGFGSLGPYWMPGYGSGGGFGFPTALSARLFGEAAVIGALGQYQLDTARAMEYREQAIKQAIRNHRSEVETYFALRQLNRQQRELNRRRLTAEQIEAQAKQGVPDRMEVHELDPDSGAIQWPVILQGDEYLAEREAIDELFEGRDRQSFGLGTRVYHDTRRLTRAMRYRLKDRISDYGSEEYVYAYQFLERLAYEARFGRE